jgi:hypothetical protein
MVHKVHKVHRYAKCALWCILENICLLGAKGAQDTQDAQKCTCCNVYTLSRNNGSEVRRVHWVNSIRTGRTKCTDLLGVHSGAFSKIYGYQVHREAEGAQGSQDA